MISYREFKGRALKVYLTVLMDEYEGNVLRAAQVAGVERTHLYKMIDKYAPELLRYEGRKQDARNRTVRDHKLYCQALREAERLGIEIPRLRFN